MKRAVPSDTVVLVDGREVAPKDARVSIFDHGFLFGDSIYEVVRTADRRLLTFDWHMERLERSARALAIQIPTSHAEIRDQVERAVARVGGPGDVEVRIIVSRGTGLLELSPESCEHSTVFVIARPLTIAPKEWYEHGIAIVVAETVRNPPRALSPAIKTGNYLNNILALQEAKRAGAQDAVMLNMDGFLTECTTSNVFFVRGGTIETPSPDCGILEGITRDLVLSVARREGTHVEEGHFTLGDLRSADEAFTTNTTKGLVPIRTIDGARLAASPGPLTRRLGELYAQEIQEQVHRAVTPRAA